MSVNQDIATASSPSTRADSLSPSQSTTSLSQRTLASTSPSASTPTLTGGQREPQKDKDYELAFAVLQSRYGVGGMGDMPSPKNHPSTRLPAKADSRKIAAPAVNYSSSNSKAPQKSPEATEGARALADDKGPGQFTKNKPSFLASIFKAS
ncbi:hypothetical protein FA15DRAFT_692333 [Coprinopsis marcescibilis]|uniref:Uncharacterized protein n=1 Tax=Coprinopsis marcescibilis TaxID=230819 RepID=A0A5C3L6B8_COPMA|nr:hypothetical protein FA15DRAFT_692333 [Coprinopsis marcescibilis]